jgi:antitoxin component YwqK of YwqJK toxin-antitoxin module
MPKKSLKGLITVVEENGNIVAYDTVTKDIENTGLLKTVFENGKLTQYVTLDEIRTKLRKNAYDSVKF